MIANFGLVVFLMILSCGARADFYIEPFASAILNGSVEYKVKDSVAGIGGERDQTNVEGHSFGLGVGYQFENELILGVDLELGMARYKFETSMADPTWSQTIIYAIVGYEFDKDAHLYAGFGKLGALDDQRPLTEIQGSALKAGLGFGFAKHLEAYVEYALYTLTESKTAGSPTVRIDQYYESFTYSTAVFGLRFPFEIKR